jgi:hypothetical protein
VCSLAACKGSGPSGSIAALGSDTLIEKNDTATVGWSVDPDDQVKVALEGNDGKPLGKNVTGTLVYKSPNGTSKTVPLTADAKSGNLVASGPKLEAGLTEINYTLDVDGKAASGTLYVPPGGTAAIVAEAKASADAAVVDGKRGPHGGIIQIVGGDRLEIASTKGGEVRVYVLDADLHPVAIGPRKIVLGVVADKPEVLTLDAESSGHFFVGHWHLHGDPIRITVHETVGGEAHDVIVGYHPGAVIIVGPAAPAIKLVVVEKWEDDVRVGPAVVVIPGKKDEDEDEHGGPPKVQINVNGKGGAKVKLR